MMSPAASNEIESPGWMEYRRASDFGIVTCSLLVTFDISWTSKEVILVEPPSRTGKCYA